MEPNEFLDLMMTALAVWREARGESDQAMLGVAWVIRNRAQARTTPDAKPLWWGGTPAAVVMKPFQFSSFNRDDPNAVRFPTAGDDWARCFRAAQAALTGQGEDPTTGACYYYDKSLDASPPKWASEMTQTCSLNGLGFFKP